MTTHLFLFQIGPVQAFIAQARRTQDLFVGSHILSELASAGVTTASRLSNFRAIFPLVNDGKVVGGAPHRFAFLSDADPQEVANTVKAGIDQRWQGFARSVSDLVWNAVGDGDWVAVFQKQITSWMEFYWVAVPYDSQNHNASYSKASASMAQRKYARTFYPVDEPGIKCTLTGAQAALDLDWKRLRKALHDSRKILLRDNERLGSLALIKRLVGRTKVAPKIQVYSTTHIAKDDPNADEETTPDKDVAGYLAVLHMDGDRMGVHLSQLKDTEEHQRFSGKLAEFAGTKVASVIKEYGGQTGQLVYSGGDDVLALLPLKHALRCAYQLRKAFKDLTGCEASAGIAVTPANLPLDRALELARDAEKMAKETYGRNAMVVVEAHGTGQMRSAGGKWDIIDFILQLQGMFGKRTISGKLGYDLQMLDHDLYGDLRPAREAEIRRLIKRRTAENATPKQVKEIQTLADSMIRLVEDVVIEKGEQPYHPVPTWSDMANWVILARFLAQGGSNEVEVQA